MGRPEDLDQMNIPSYEKTFAGEAGKLDHSENPAAKEEESEEYRKPTHYKVLAVVVALFFSIGSHYATNTLNALKGGAKKQLGLTNSEYGIIQSMVYLVNTIMPMLGGVLMDRFGTVYGAVGSTSCIFFGNLIIALSTYLSKPFWLMVTGRVFHGLGSGMIVVTQDTILGKWFSSSTIGIVIGLQIAGSRLANFSAHALSAKIMVAADSISGPLWVSVGACFISWAVTLVYAFYLHKEGGEHISAKAKRAPFSYKRLFLLPLGYWIMPLATMVLAGIWTPFLGSVAEYIKKNYADAAHSAEYNEINAGFKSSVTLALAVVLSPLMGGILDMYGHRSIFLGLSSICTCLSLVTFMSSNTEVALYCALVLFSLGLTIGPVPLTSSIALVLPVDMIGTGMGVYKTAMALGIAFNHMFMGIVQDASPNKDYQYVMPMLLVFSFLGIFVALLYALYSYRYSYRLLEVPHNKRQALIAEHNDQLHIHRDPETMPKPSFLQKLVSLTLITMIGLCWIFVITIIVISRTQQNWTQALAKKFVAK